jgi:hypothetical protein
MDQEVYLVYFISLIVNVLVFVEYTRLKQSTEPSNETQLFVFQKSNLIISLLIDIHLNLCP